MEPSRELESLPPESSETPSEEERKEALTREILVRVADKWTLLVIFALEEGEMRFSRLREKVGGISQKMLTKTLRQLERDGLVTRRVHAVVPPPEGGFKLSSPRLPQQGFEARCLKPPSGGAAT